MKDIAPDDLVTVPGRSKASPSDVARWSAYWLIGILAFLAGLLCSQCARERADSKSRIEWPETKPATVENPRKVL